MKKSATLLSLLALAVTANGCKHRDPVWDTKPDLEAVGLRGSAALIDVAANRAMMLAVQADLTIDPVSIPIGHGYAAAEPTVDGSKLLVLSHGDVPRRRAEDQKPMLTVIEGSSSPKLFDRFVLGDPLSGLAIDPQSGFAIVYPSADDLAFVKNPNELVVVDLSRHALPSNPTPVTLRSFGGRPKSFVFTPDLFLPGGHTRLLVALTDHDVGLLDLNQPELGDVTIRLSSTGEHLKPAGVAVHDGDPDRDDDARLAIRLENDPNIVVVAMDAAAPTDNVAHAWRPKPNVIFAGGVPSDVAFVKTDGGIQVAALVPSTHSLALIDPAKGTPSNIDLGESFEHLSIITDVVGGTDLGADVALLWSSHSTKIGFLALGKTVGKPYKSLDTLELSVPIDRVLDVPHPNDRLKLLAAPDGESFFLLDLLERTAAPILASDPDTKVTIGRGGHRAWLLANEAPKIASLDLDDFHPQNLELDYPAYAAFDVERKDGQRALIAVHDTPSVGLTVLDGLNPSLENAVEYQGVLLGSLP